MYQQKNEVEVTKVYERLRASRKPINILIGGARSSKSHSIAQLLIEFFWNESNKKILVSRKTGPALKLTAYALIVELLQEYGMYPYVIHNKTDRILVNPKNGSRFQFIAIDDPTKIKSSDFNYVWVEEADEFDWADWLVIQTRLSSRTIISQPNRIFLSLNPSDENGWVNQKLVLSPKFSKRLQTFWSNYEDNPFLSKAYIESLRDLEHQDEAAWMVFGKGKWGVLRDFIYKPYEVLTEYPESFDEEIYGLDFGFNNPSSLLKIGIKDRDNCYLEELLYKTGLKNSDLIKRAKLLIPEEKRGCPIYADAAEPARIAEFNDEGFNVYPAVKSVKDGIDFCQRKKFYTRAENVNLNKERGKYRWRRTKNGDLLDEPVKFMDHCMDGKRYALYTHFKGNLEPSVSMI